MRVPISWLKEYVPFTLSVEEIASRLTLAGIEAEYIESIGAFSKRVVVGEIVKNQKCENADSLRHILMDVGEPIEVVSAAPNLAAVPPGTKVATALPEAIIFDGSSSGYRLHSVAPSIIHGMESAAVLCSKKELGITPDHTGVLILDPDEKVGVPVLDCIELSESSTADQVLVLSILPNIARCQSIIGVAREIAALTGVEGVYQPELSHHKITCENIDLPIALPNLCRRFSIVHVDGIQLMASPDLMQLRLVLCGFEPVNNIVDATNYAMLELGQPMHAYDADKLPSSILGVRFSRPGERLRLLGHHGDKESVSLGDNVLLVVSDDHPVAVAGVMGGVETAISEKTARIQIESANFDFITIRKNQSALKIRSETSARFSRGIDPTLTILGIRRVLKLLEETCPNLRVLATVDASQLSDSALEIELTLAEVNNSLGTDFCLPEIVKLLRCLGIHCYVDKAQELLRATITSARADLRLPCDLIEEIARLRGYNHIPSTMPEDPIPMHQRNRHLEIREMVRDTMVRIGLQEIMSYTLTSPEIERALFAGHPDAYPDPPYLRMLNPVTSDHSTMRRTLIPGLLQAVHANLRYTDVCHLFEIGVVVLPEEKPDSSKLPLEPYRVALAMTGKIQEPSVHRNESTDMDFYDAANAVDFLLNHLHIQGAQFDAADVPPYQTGVCARVSGNGKEYGYVGAIHPSVAEAFDLEGHTVFCAELDLEVLIKDSVRFFSVCDPLRFPSIELDISVVVAEDLQSRTLTDLVKEASGEVLQDVSVIDVYVGPQISKHSKAIALRLNLNARNRTLTMEEARTVREQVVRHLQESINAIIRE